MAVSESLERKVPRMSSLDAALSIAKITDWAYRGATKAGLRPSRKINIQRIQFGSSIVDEGKGHQDIVELRRDRHRKVLSFCAVRAMLPKNSLTALSQGGDYLTARMQFLQLERKSKKPEILLDSWVSSGNPIFDLPKSDFDEIEADSGDTQPEITLSDTADFAYGISGHLDHVVLGRPADVLSSETSQRIIHIVNTIITTTANEVNVQREKS